MVLNLALKAELIRASVPFVYRTDFNTAVLDTATAHVCAMLTQAPYSELKQSPCSFRANYAMVITWENMTPNSGGTAVSDWIIGVTWHGHKHFSQWQRSFPMKAVLPSAKKVCGNMKAVPWLAEMLAMFL